ncbi:hypothetical protein BOW52_08165 [Solemya elarraichensis gill symbiont]|uniref:TonB C-terminal domain-containing protein n=1 Tax=Solemya elarraichensis gill symbiont TaxID=1918949 RepID=A0A1T2L0U0_9GAMM|nr:hypothetical protein BOW52_08165 [Solemya elarraichensis gill symbiont]
MIVQFTISKTGHMFGLKVKKSSGNKTLDRAAIKTVKNSMPFETIPASSKEDRIHVVLPIEYKLS